MVLLGEYGDELFKLDALVSVFVELLDDFVDVLGLQLDVEFFEDCGYFLC